MLSIEEKQALEAVKIKYSKILEGLPKGERKGDMNELLKQLDDTEYLRQEANQLFLKTNI